MLQRASWLMLPFGPAPTISQSIARYLVGTAADVVVGLQLLDTEGPGVVAPEFVLTGSFGLSWLPLLCTVKTQEGRGCVEAEGLEVQCEAMAGPPGLGRQMFCVEAPLWRGAWTCPDCPLWWLYVCLTSTCVLCSEHRTFLRSLLFFLFRFPVFLCGASSEVNTWILMSDMAPVQRELKGKIQHFHFKWVTSTAPTTRFLLTKSYLLPGPAAFEYTQKLGEMVQYWCRNSCPT